MKSKIVLYGLGFAVLLVLAALALIVTDNRKSSSEVVPSSNPVAPVTAIPTVNATGTALRGTPGTPPPGLFDSKTTPGLITGMPAIKPRLNSTNKSTPTFTEQDVKDYVAAHPDLPRTKSEVPPTVTKVEFITYQEAKKREGGAVYGKGIPDDQLLCFAELSGNFTMYGPPAGAASARKMSFTKTTLVFNAQTGNALTL